MPNSIIYACGDYVKLKSLRQCNGLRSKNPIALVVGVSIKIDHVKSKDILSYLDEKIGFDFSKTPSESDLKYYADKLLNLLIEEKEKGNI